MARLNLTPIDHLRNFGWTARWRLAPAPVRVAALARLAIVEVGDATREAGALFERTFAAKIPRAPRHFVIAQADDPQAPAFAYVHYARCGDAWLAGGLVADAMRFRQLDRDSADAVRREGGFAEWLMRASCAALDGPAVFARIGDRRSETVNARVGFVRTPHPHLHVLWRGAPLEADRLRIVARVLAVGAF